MQAKLSTADEKAMREQTLSYVAAVLKEHPELRPPEPEEEFTPDPYPALPRVEPLLPTDGIRGCAYEVSCETGYSLAALRGKSRQHELVRARWECYARARAKGYSLPQIGKFFNRDHTTVLHGLRQMGCANATRAWLFRFRRAD